MTRSGIHKGIVLSPGICRGTAFLMGRGAGASAVDAARVDRRPDEEVLRFRLACERSEAELARLRAALTGPMIAVAAGILEAQELFLRDPAFVDRVERRIRDTGHPAETAAQEVIDELSAALASAQDPYLRERSADIRDIGHRVMVVLGGGDHAMEIPPGSILVAGELSPSLVATLPLERVRGVVTELGAKASHAAILLRSAGIPAVGGIARAMQAIEPGSSLLIDAVAGLVFVDPGAAVRAEYDRLEADLLAHDQLLAHEIDLPSTTRDGTFVHLAANLGKTADTEAALRWNAQAVGLFRTEFAFDIRGTFPSEAEQAAVLEGIAVRLHPRPIVFRLLDLGSDKTLEYFPLPEVVNPALGLRGTRLLLAHPEILRTQLRAILRVSAAHPVSVLLPMIGGVDEVRAVRAVLRDITGDLLAEGIAVDQRLPLGVMIEVPSAVLVAAELAREVDFLSLGTNDLAQYLLAADRDDAAMSGYYRMLHPAVLRAIRTCTRAGERARKPVTICGEMAGDPYYTELLIGLGLRSFSVSPRQIGELRHEIRQVDAGRAGGLARRLLRCATRDEIRRILDRRRARRGDRSGGPTPAPSAPCTVRPGSWTA